MCLEMNLAKMYSALSQLGSAEWPKIEMSREYAAGLFDGEGHVGVCKHKRKTGTMQYLTRVQIAIKQKELLEPFVYFGGSIKKVDAARWNKNAGVIHKWTIHNKEAQRFLLAILPSLRNEDKIYSAKCVLEMEFLRKRPGGNVIDTSRVPKQEFLYRETIRTNSRRGKFEEINQEDDLAELTKLLNENTKMTNSKIPDDVFADTIIRIFDTCGHYGIDLEQAIEIKMKYNESRPYKHNKVI